MNIVEKNIYFLNMKELRGLCEQYNIPYEIYMEKGTEQVKTGAYDRKNILIERILNKMNGKDSRKTLYRSNVVELNPKTTFKKTDLMKYGEYKNGNSNILKLLKKLTNGKFKFGALSCELIDKYWRNGKAPTFNTFAKKYLSKLNDDEHPEWRYIQFIREGGTIKEWNKKRNIVAKKVIAIIKIKISDNN
jgi:hypothetical protein